MCRKKKKICVEWNTTYVLFNLSIIAVRDHIYPFILLLFLPFQIESMIAGGWIRSLFMRKKYGICDDRCPFVFFDVWNTLSCSVRIHTSVFLKLLTRNTCQTTNVWMDIMNNHGKPTIFYIFCQYPQNRNDPS